MARRFEGKTALITGASAGIGAEVARGFVREGAAVILNARRIEPLTALAEELRQAGGTIETVAGDVGRLEDCRALMARAVSHGFDILVNNAGAHFRGPFERRTVDEIATMADVNLRAPLVLTHLALPHFRARGSGTIIHVASLAGKAPLADAATYSATKFGLRTFSIALAMELRDAPIRSSVVSPGPVDTEFLMESLDEVADVFFAPSLSDPSEVAAAVLDCAADGRRERAFPRGPAALATVGYVFPPLRSLLEPFLKRRGRRIKERYRRQRASPQGR